MDIDQFLPPPYTIPVKYFLLYFKSGQYEKACCEIKYSFETCLLLCTREFIHFLIENSLDSIFCTIAYSLNKRKLSINPLINPDDFLLACSKCNAFVISIISSHSAIKISPVSNDSIEKSALQRILDRNDPQLLLKCLQLVPDFIKTESRCTAPLYYVLEHQLNNLIDEMWILINSFDIPENELLLIARNWETYCSGERIPILKELYEKHIYQYQLKVEKARIKNNEPTEFISEPTDVNDINCLNVKTNMLDADRLIRFLIERIQRLSRLDQTTLDLVVDPKSTSILMVLPYELMKSVNFLLNNNLYLKNSLIGEEAVGEGPVQDMFNAYFRQITSVNSYFDSNENTTSILPTQDDSKLHESQCVFYGLGIVFLKMLIDSRPIGNFHEEVVAQEEVQNEDQQNEEGQNEEDANEKDQKSENKGSLNCSLHPWIFQALLDRMETDPKKIFYEALLFDNQFYNAMYNYCLNNDEEMNGIDDFAEKIKQNKMYLNSRGVYYKALHDGFYLNYIEGLTPSEFRENLEYAKKELDGFYKIIETVSPTSLQFLLVGPSIINADFLLSKFEFEPFRKIDTSGDGNDESLQFIGEDYNKGKIYWESVEIFKTVMKDWCNEEYQQNIKDFLKYLSGVPTLSPLYQQKWKIGFDFSVEKNSILMTWACDKIVRAPLFESVDNCKKVIIDTIKYHKVDPVNRDIITK